MNSFNNNYIQYNFSTNENNVILDNTKIYIDILNYLKNCKCKVLFSINNNAITNYLYKDYIKQDYLKNYDTTKIKKNNEEQKFSKNKENILLISNF